jgi:hypothetical protein
MQYSFLGVIPVVLLNKSIQYFIPDVDMEKSSLEILAEIFLQILFMFFGVIFIHRTITFFPTYSGFKYDNFVLTNVILAFFIIVFSIQTKLGLKVNILFDRTLSIWNGGDKPKFKKYSKHDIQDSPLLPNPSNSNSSSNSNNSNYSSNNSSYNSSNNSYDDYLGPIAANSFSNLMKF